MAEELICCDKFQKHSGGMDFLSGMKFCPYCGKEFVHRLTAALANPEPCPFQHAVPARPNWQSEDRRYYLKEYCPRCGDLLAIVLETGR